MSMHSRLAVVCFAAVVLAGYAVAQPPDTVWTMTYGGMPADEGWSVRQTTDGGYIVAGHTYSFGAGLRDVYLVKVDEYGDTVWTAVYGGAEQEYAYSVRQTVDGGYIVAGKTKSSGGRGFDVYVVRTDGDGDVVWTRVYGSWTGDDVDR